MPRILILWFSAVFFIFFFSLPSVQPKESAGDLSARLRSIEERIKKIEEGQKQISEKEEKILAEINSLRVWISANC